MFNRQTFHTTIVPPLSQRPRTPRIRPSTAVVPPKECYSHKHTENERRAGLATYKKPVLDFPRTNVTGVIACTTNSLRYNQQMQGQAKSSINPSGSSWAGPAWTGSWTDFTSQKKRLKPMSNKQTQVSAGLPSDWPRNNRSPRSNQSSTQMTQKTVTPVIRPRSPRLKESTIRYTHRPQTGDSSPFAPISPAVLSWTNQRRQRNIFG